MREHFPKKALLLFLIFCIVVFIGFLHADKIKIKTENGVTVVYNPKKPTPPPGTPTKLVLIEDLTIGTQEGEEEYMFFNLAGLDVDDEGNIYALDRKQCYIKVFNSEGKLIRTIGKKGQGPGETQEPRDISITPQKEIMVNDRRTRRLLFFRLDGTFLREVSGGKMWLFSNPKMDSKGNIIADFMVMNEGKAMSELKKFNSQLDPVLTISSVEIARYPIINPLFPFFYSEVTKEDNVIWGFPTKYEFQVLNPRGKLIKKIIRNYDPVKITKEEKEERLKGMYGDQPLPSDVKIEWPKHHNAFMYLTLDDEGRIFTRTYEKVKGGDEYYYDVFDSEGRYIAKLILPDRPRVWKKNKMYSIYEDEEGYRYIKRYKVEWK